MHAICAEVKFNYVKACGAAEQGTLTCTCLLRMLNLPRSVFWQNKCNRCQECKKQKQSDWKEEALAHTRLRPRALAHDCSRHPYEPGPQDSCRTATRKYLSRSFSFFCFLVLKYGSADFILTNDIHTAACRTLIETTSYNLPTGCCGTWKTYRNLRVRAKDRWKWLDFFSRRKPPPWWNQVASYECQPSESVWSLICFLGGRRLILEDALPELSRLHLAGLQEPRVTVLWDCQGLFIRGW